MAVTITTKFYNGTEFRDLSKIVFTSPNIDSPNTAGTRSHILPGELDLGMWYEDTSNMYRIEDKQEIDTSTYFGYAAQVYDQFDMDNPPLYITFDKTNQSDWIEYVRERVDEAGGSWPIKYKLITGNYGDISFEGCTYSGSGITASITTGDGWVVPVVDLPGKGYINFPFIFYMEKMEFGCKNEYVTGVFSVMSGSEVLFDGYRSGATETQSFDIDATEKYSNYSIEIERKPSEANGASVTYLKFTGYYESSVYTIDSITCSSGIDPINMFNPVGWYVDEAETDPHWVTVGFSSPKRVTKIDFCNYDGYQIKDYKIQACTTISGTYIDLYSGRAVFDPAELQTISFSNYIGYNYYRFYFYSRWAASDGYGITKCNMYECDIDESVTNPITLYIDNENTIDVSHINNAESTDYLFKLDIDSVAGTGVVVSGTNIYGWGQTESPEGQVKNTNSIVFEVTIGECYNCRLTAWDDITHSTTNNHLIASNKCRASCIAFNANGTSTEPTENEGMSFIHPPVLNRIFKGNVVYEGENFFYGDFDMIYRTGSVLGDYLIFKPMLYDIDDTVPYGIHDHLIVLHYSYT